MRTLELEFEDRVARRAVTLLPLRQVATRLQTVVCDPARSSWQLLDVVKACPMLAASVMRLANQEGASPCPVATLPLALTRVSEEELTRLTLAAGLGASSNDESPLLALRRGVMQDSLTVALLCERLAPEFDLLPDELFLAGLLHDVGTMIALGTLEQLIALHPATAPREATAWMALAERHHVALGLSLAERWGLPSEVRRAIERHHLPDDGAEDATAVVRLGDSLLGLMREGVALGEAQLPCLEGIAPGRRARLFEKLTGVPAVVAGFEAQRPYSSSPSVSLLLPAKPQERGISYPVRVSGGRAGSLELLSPRLLLLRLDGQLAENYLMELELELAGAPLKLWVRVGRGGALGADGTAEAEVVPFAPSVSTVEHLQELWNSQQGPERAA